MSYARAAIIRDLCEPSSIGSLAIEIWEAVDEERQSTSSRSSPFLAPFLDTITLCRLHTQVMGRRLPYKHVLQIGYLRP